MIVDLLIFVGGLFTGIGSAVAYLIMFGKDDDEG